MATRRAARTRRALIGAALAAVALPSPAAAVELPRLPGAPVLPAPQHARYAEDRLIVHFEPGAARDAVLASAGADVLHDLPRIGAVGLRVEDEQAARRHLQRAPGVRLVERVPLLDWHGCDEASACTQPDDPLFRRQWGLVNDERTVLPDYEGAPVPLAGADVRAPFAWRLLPRTLRPARVAVIDSGIDQDHEDLAGRTSSYAWRETGDATDRIGHGTAVAGIIAAVADNGVGMAGVAWNSDIVGFKAMDDPTGSASCDGVAAAIGAIVSDPSARSEVINISAGTPARCEALERAIADADRSGVLIVASAGNTGTEEPSYPAALPDVVSVAATDSGDRRAPFSSFGATVDLAAPGMDILTLRPSRRNRSGETGYGYVDGTSFAAPLVAGVAALIWPSVSDADGDGRRNDDVRARLLEAADPIDGTGRAWRHGRLNACRALSPGSPDCDAPAVEEVAQAVPAPAPAREHRVELVPGRRLTSTGLPVVVRCPDGCRTRVRGTAETGKRRYRLRSAGVQVAPGASRTVVLRAPIALRRAVRSGRRVSALVSAGSEGRPVALRR